MAIHLHGDRALANWLLLPREAVVLHLVPRTRPYHERQLQLARLVVSWVWVEVPSVGGHGEKGTCRVF